MDGIQCSVTEMAEMHPVKLYLVGDTWGLRWGQQRKKYGDSPTISIDEQATANPLITSPAQVEHLLATQPLAKPALFIFHLSRCGSTLLAKLLAADPNCRVVIEPSYIGAFLRRSHHLNERRFQKLAAPLIRSCGLGANPDQKLVIKFQSHAIWRCAEIVKTIPDVPAVLLYRQPLEILSALAEEPPGFLQRPYDRFLCEQLKLTAKQISTLRAEEVAVEYLRSLLASASRSIGDFSRLTNYAELPSAVNELRTSLLHCPGVIDASTIQLISATHSKAPGRVFRSDSATKRSTASAYLRDAARSLATQITDWEVHRGPAANG